LKNNNIIVILCGGRGRRMGRLSEKVPKPLMKIRNQTILEMKIRKYIEQGFNNFVLCIGYKGDLIRKLISDKDFSNKIIFSEAGSRAGILKRIISAKDLFSDYVLITYGDTYSNIDLSDLAASHCKNNNEATIVVAPIKSPFGLVEYDNNYRVTYFKEKPVLNYYIGYAAINKNALEATPNKIINKPDGEGLIEFYNMIMLAKKLGVYYHDGLQVTFNTEDELTLAKERIINFYTSS
jgi:glucose-1-phosphate cytidylyltransferase|tara:strand:- start:2967 stop:3677 length:711 start_codon:yes stop_codon:yes gene_type:complete